MENADKHYSIIISEKASEMLVIHARYLANVSVEAAQKLVEEFTASAKALESFPERNPWLNDPALPANKYRKLLFYKRYLLIDQVKRNEIYVEYVLDCRQNYRWLL